MRAVSDLMSGKILTQKSNFESRVGGMVGSGSEVRVWIGSQGQILGQEWESSPALGVRPSPRSSVRWSPNSDIFYSLAKNKRYFLKKIFHSSIKQ